MAEKDPQTPAEPKEPTEPTTPSPPQITEKDLMALKSKVEKAEEKLTVANASHKTELEAAGTKFNETNQTLLQAEAKVTSLEEQITQSGNSYEELKDVKQKLEDAEKSVEDLTTKVLDSRKQTIVATYNIPAESIAEKTIEQLDNYEEALKSVIATKGIGNYAAGGGGGGAATPEAPLDRAHRILQEAKAAGHVYGGGDFKHPSVEPKKE